MQERSSEPVSSNAIPRRSRLYEMTPAERAIFDAAQAVEAAGCDPLLTEALTLLNQARDKVADFVDRQLSTRKVSDQHSQQLIDTHLNEVRPEIGRFFLSQREDFETRRCPTHPGSQKLHGGLKLHTLQVIRKALELNQSCNRQELIECCLVHDLRGYESLPLTDAQRLAIAATKGKAIYKDWRPTPHYRFVVLVLIADMWSAFINEEDRER